MLSKQQSRQLINILLFECTYGMVQINSMVRESLIWCVCRLELLECQMIQKWWKPHQLRTSGYQYGTRSSSSHWVFQNWLCSELKSKNMTLLGNMTLVAKHVSQFQSSELGSELFLCIIEEAKGINPWGFWCDLTLTMRNKLISIAHAMPLL